MLGVFTIYCPVTADASIKRLHDPKVETKTVERKTLPTLRERVTETMSKFKPLDDVELYDDDDFTQTVDVPQTLSTYDTSIIGTPIATQQQCVKYLLRNNPRPNLKVSAEEIVAYYYEEGRREGIRPDVAFCQALKETGFFRYGGDVVPEQNNYCGLGTTGGGVRGEYFSTPQLGVRAHIQHLLAYSSTRRPTMPVVDPRYGIVRQAYGSRTLGTWQDLNGRWAVPGRYYGQEILSMFRDVLIQ
ncbi:MAG: glucosaminidase domain-containing protein [Quinella sp. 1Q7]|nr:glucosaminidase domain-containing protein [Quinella sp. 1Q7]